MPNSVEVNPDTCIVIGAGIGGMCAAAALAATFTNVVIFEKDSLSDPSASRKSIAQSQHLHSLLLGGRDILESLFPGFTDDLVAAGGNLLKAGLDQKIYEFGAWMPARDLGMTISTQSRTLLENVVRSRVKQIANIEIVDRAKVSQLCITDGTVTGVAVTRKDAEVEIHNSSLVIDSAGLSGTIAKQIPGLSPGIDEITETVSSKIVYVTALIKKPEAWRHTKENVLIVADPDKTRGGGLLDIENDTWVVSLNGRNGIEPPTDFKEWLAYAATLPDKAIWERIKECEPLQKLQKFNKPISFVRRFDKVDNLPLGYFPMGDTVNSVNPTFGQGMALALEHARALADSLDLSNKNAWQQAYLKTALGYSLKAWRQTVAYESMFNIEDETKKNKFAALQALVLNKHKQAHHDADVHLQLFKQAQMLG
ncbi:2-polyprenyl-6-methoxyphenol hydroxylase-like FAD-dependent oxidoreductase [Alteromonadaceae bacterium 2753L.S.0a.02]|nr:2-polyprenyl-6-methoxyphenol hydroxylase-like FAD-dependent oxidoreductase [Alteromonadaceae bacterium 2753L.S.0a.02]